MKALGVSQSKGKPTAVPAPPLPPLCLLNGFACWGTATKRAYRSWGGGKGGRDGGKQKIFLCVCLPLYNSILTVNSSIHKTQGQFFFFFLKREKPQGRLQPKRPLSGVLKRMVFSPNHFTEAKQTNTKS